MTPYRLARDDESIFSEADVERLPGAAQRQGEAIRRVRRGCCDRHRAFKGRDGASEGLDEVVALRHLARDEHWDHLGIGGDLLGDAQAVSLDEFVVVIDVAVEHADHVGAGAPRFFVIERMGVGLADDAHGRPARVAQHQHFGSWLAQQRLQQGIAAHGGAQCAHVVAEFTDLRRMLVDEIDGVCGRAHGAMLEQRVQRAARDQSSQMRRLRVDATHDHADAGGVPAAHFQAIERRQGCLDARVARDGVRRRRIAREIAHRRSGGQAIHAQRPKRVLHLDQRLVAQFDAVVGIGASGAVETLFQRDDAVVERFQPLLAAVGRRGICEQSADPRDAAQVAVESVQRVGRGEQSIPSDTAVQRCRRGGDRGVEHVGRRRNTKALASQDSDDAAHRVLVLWASAPRTVAGDPTVPMRAPDYLLLRSWRRVA